MATKKKNKTKFPKLQLHTLLTALSFWGSAARLGFILFFAVIVFILQVVDAQYTLSNMTVLSAVLSQGQVLVYAVVSFLLLDVGYVTVAKRYSFPIIMDRLLLIGAEITLAIGYFLPYFVIVSERVMYVTRHVFVAVLLVIALRIVMGLLYGKAAVR